MINELKSLGISAAAVFPADEIKFNVVFRKMCEDNLCGRYGKNYKCPPYIGEPDVLEAEVLSYKTAVLIQTICNIEDSYDIEGMNEGGVAHSENIKKAVGYIKENIPHERLLTLGAGGCLICPKCGAADGTPCRFPEEAKASVEGYCIDAANITTSHGLKYINGENTVSYVALFLLA